MWFDRELLERMEVWRERGARVALATIVAAAGSSPRPVGTAIGVSETGEICGALSNGCIENEIIEEAASVFATGEPKVLTYGVGDGVVAAGLLCGGEITIYLERLDAAFITDLRAAYGSGRDFTIVSAPGTKVVRVEQSIGEDAAARFDPSTREGEQRYVGLPSLVLLGAGDIAEALATLGRFLGFLITLVDPRSEYVARYAQPHRYDRIIAAWPDEVLGEIPIGRTTAVVSLFHEERFELAPLARLLKNGAAYVGALGSRRVQREREHALREQGVSDDELRRLHAPVGLDIGAQTPKEIALAIISEIIATRNARAGGQLRTGSGPIGGAKTLH